VRLWTNGRARPGDESSNGDGPVDDRGSEGQGGEPEEPSTDAADVNGTGTSEDDPSDSDTTEDRAGGNNPEADGGEPEATDEDVEPSAEPGDTEPGDTEPGDTEPGDTEPGDTEPGDAEEGVPDDKAAESYASGVDSVETQPGEDDQAEPSDDSDTDSDSHNDSDSHTDSDSHDHVEPDAATDEPKPAEDADTEPDTAAAEPEPVEDANTDTEPDEPEPADEPGPADDENAELPSDDEADPAVADEVDDPAPDAYGKSDADEAPNADVGGSEDQDAANDEADSAQCKTDRSDTSLDASAESTDPTGSTDSLARNGSPTVSDGLRRGDDPGQAEGLPGVPLSRLARPVTAVFLVFALVGALIGLGQGSEQIVRRELVYTLDESVPDSFLREDRRLLTQVVTMQSDAVLGPVAEQHDLTIDDLRDRIDIETVDLSEVLRLDVRAADEPTALSISDAIIDRYLAVSTESVPADDNDALLERRSSIAEQLDAADTALRSLQQTDADDARLQTTEESLERQIDLARLQIDRLQGLLDDALVQPPVAARQAALRAELTAAETELLALEDQLAEVRVDRAELTAAASAEPSLTRQIERLETDLATIDDELAARELGPLVASPIRELGQPTFTERSEVAGGLRGLAVGLLLAVPVAAVVALVVRRRQLWRN
jgi:hypothetical protein